MDGHTKYAQTYAHSEANRYEQGAACEARRESANTGEGFGSAESAKKPAAYIHCGTVCSMDVYFISPFIGRFLDDQLTGGRANGVCLMFLHGFICPADN